MGSISDEGSVTNGSSARRILAEQRHVVQRKMAPIGVIRRIGVIGVLWGTGTWLLMRKSCSDKASSGLCAYNIVCAGNQLARLAPWTCLPLLGIKRSICSTTTYVDQVQLHVVMLNHASSKSALSRRLQLPRRGSNFGPWWIHYLHSP